MRWVAALALVGCSNVHSTPGDDSSTAEISLTIDRRPAVHSVASLTITLDAGAGPVVDHVTITSDTFPVVYQVTHSGGFGTLLIDVEALDNFGTPVGVGITSAALDAPTASLMIEASDFVVNTTVTGNQFLSNDFEAAGLQLAATQFMGVWMVGFREDCTSCNIYGRRFSSTGLPEYTDVASGIAQFSLNTTPTTTAATPALTSSVDRTLAFWDFTDTVGNGHGIACRTVDLPGSSSTPVTITTDAADVVTASSIAFGGNVVVTWQTFMTTQVVRAMIVDGFCQQISPPVTVSIATGSLGARRSHAAANDQLTLLYAWILDGDLYARFGVDSGQLAPTESVLLQHSAVDEVDFVRVAPWGHDFAVAVRWGNPNGSGPGRIELYRMTTSGQFSAVRLITDASGSDFASNKAFGIASRDDGMLMVVWHTCPTGPGSCNVFARALRMNGEATTTEPFVVPTTTASDQINPSVVAVEDASGSAFVVAWNDSSGAGADSSGTAVRARIIYPPP
jgi:hypothetical protein